MLAASDLTSLARATAIDKSLSLGLSAVKINCVVMRGLNDDEIVKFVEMTRDKPVEVRFIEYVPWSPRGFIYAVSLCALWFQVHAI